MHPPVITRKKAHRVSFSILCVITIIVCFALFPMVVVGATSQPVTIRANIKEEIPLAAFTFAQSGLVVIFTDRSTGTGQLTYTWVFGDGTTSTEQNPSHTYITAGPYAVIFTVTNAQGITSSTSTTVTVTPAPVAPVLDPIDDMIVTENTLLTFTVTATDANGGALVFSLAPGLAGAVPDGAAITAAGVFTWTPSEAQGPGTYTFDVMVSDGSLSDSETITVTVTEVNVAPVLGAIGAQTVVVGQPLTFTATATDANIPAQTLTFSLVDAPAGAVPAGASITPAGFFTWTPTVAQGPGSYTFNVVVSDGFLIDSETITITVTKITEPLTLPVATLPTGFVDSPYTPTPIPVTGGSGSYRFSVPPGELPPDLSLDTVTGIISGTIRNPPTVPYTYSFTITATDTTNGNSVTQTFTITVIAAPPKSPSTGGTDDLDNTNIGVSFGEPAVALSQDLLAPPQENVVGSGLAGFTGITVTTQPSGERVLDVAPELIGAVSIIGNTITVTQPGYTLEIVVAGKITEEDGHIIGYDIESILLTTDPVDANITIGNVSAYLEAYLNSLPKGAEIKTSISLPGELDLMKAFQEALRKEGKTLDGWAYNYNVDKKNFDSCGSTNVTMTVTQKWLTESKQTIENVHIIRLADDGSTQVLPIISVVRDPITGDYTLTGYSRDGCSVFGLVTAKATAVEQAEQPNATVVAVSKPAMSTNVGMYGWLMGIVTENPWIILIIGAVVALMAYFGWYRRRL